MTPEFVLFFCSAPAVYLRILLQVSHLKKKKEKSHTPKYSAVYQQTKVEKTGHTNVVRTSFALHMYNMGIYGFYMFFTFDSLPFNI
jgi:hypothetical protein